MKFNARKKSAGGLRDDLLNFEYPIIAAIVLDAR